MKKKAKKVKSTTCYISIIMSMQMRFNLKRGLGIVNRPSTLNSMFYTFFQHTSSPPDSCRWTKHICKILSV